MLHALIDYADKVGISGEAGFVPKTVRWLITFGNRGEYKGVMSLSDPEDKKGKGQSFPKVPHLKFSGDTPMRQFLVDTAQYVLLYGEDRPTDKLLTKHHYFLNLLQEAASVEPFLNSVAEALSHSEIREQICRDLVEKTPKAKPSDNVTFAEITGQGARTIAKETGWHDWWRGYFPTLFKKADHEPEHMRCFISGELTEPLQTHPKIKNLGDVGGNVETTLVGFNKDSFCSFGLKQSSNAAVSSDMAEKYAATLNHLLVENSRRLIGSKIVYWYVGEEVKPEDDPIPALFGDETFGEAEVEEIQNDETRPMTSKRTRYQAEQKVHQLLDAIKSGRKPELRNARFCALTLSGNSGRVVVNDWMEGQFEELVESIDCWFNDTAIISREGDREIKSHKLLSILAAPVRELKEISKPLEMSIWNSAIKNSRIEDSVMAHTLQRIKYDVLRDEAARHSRIGLIKAYCNRNERIPNMENQLNTKIKDSAYLCGRILAILANIQYKALGDVGAGIVQRYYAAASATPGLVLGRLVRLAQTGHLPKIEPVRLRKWFDRQLAEVWALLEEAPPATLPLEKQTLFAMGYYQQKAYRVPKEEEIEETEDSNINQ